METDAGAAAEAAPLSDRFSLDSVIRGIGDDLNALRAGSITVEDARVRAELSKQFLSGLRIVIAAQKYLEQNSRRIGSGDATEADNAG